MSGDAAVRSTDQDALLSRWSAVSLGYLSDPFLPHFLSSAQRRTPERRPPLINLGTHARTYVIDQLVRSFLVGGTVSDDCPMPTTSRRQVLSLGAGSDTRFWRMRQEFAATWDAKWTEVDFAECTSKKARTVTTKSELRSALGENVQVVQAGQGIQSQFFNLLPIDLRRITLDQLNLDPDLPTLVLAECLFVYIDHETVSRLLTMLTSTIRDLVIVVYDPFGLGDSFGQVMKRNLLARGLQLPGVDGLDTIEHVKERLGQAGFANVDGWSISWLREHAIPAQELERVMAIERIDEVEELNLILSHYAISVGSKGAIPLLRPGPTA